MTRTIISRWVHILPTVGLAALSVLTSAAALGGVGVWTTNEPVGGGKYVIADPRTGVLYAGTSAGVAYIPLSKSTDNGATWAYAGLELQNTRPLATSPPATVYAAGDYSGQAQDYGYLWVTSDGGANWNQFYGPGSFTTFGLVVDPFTPTTLYLVSNNASPSPFPVGGSGLRRSRDGGVTWTETDLGLALGQGGTSIIGIAADPSTPATLYLATTSNNSGALQGLFKTQDSASSWTLLTSSLGYVVSLAVDPTNPFIVYAGSSHDPRNGAGGGVYKSVDGGGTFAQTTNGLTNTSVQALVIDPVRPNRVYAGTDGGVFTSSDGGASWQSMNIGLTDLMVYTLAIDSTGTYLHAGTASGVFDYQTSACGTSTRALCLNNGRFSVTAWFQSTPTGPSAQATAVPLTNDTGYFWFFDATNIELVVKVLTGCAVNGHYWVFGGGLTNLGVQLQVTDTRTGVVKTYSNNWGTAFQPIQDTSAFPCP